MSSRFFITGVQLGMIKALISTAAEKDKQEVNKLIYDIQKKQYLGEKDELIPPWFKKISGDVEWWQSFTLKQLKM